MADNRKLFDFPSNQDIVPGEQATQVWLQTFQRWQTVIEADAQSGTTAQRPTKGLWIGRRYFDTTLNQPIFVASMNPTVWVGADGQVAGRAPRAYQNMTGVRAIGGTYTNDTGREIVVFVQGTAGGQYHILSCRVNGGEVAATEQSWGAGVWSPVRWEVPAGANYTTVNSGGPVYTLASWIELR